MKTSKGYVWGCSSCRIKTYDMNKTIEEKIYGAIYGTAIGDALGYPVRKNSYRQIVERYGNPGVTFFELSGQEKAKISADTQMMMFTATGLMFGLTRMRLKGGLGAGIADYIAESYVEWFRTQTNTVTYDEWHANWLRDIPELSCVRSPSRTTIDVLKKATLQNSKIIPADSYGCGCIARTLPIPLMFCNQSHQSDLKEIVKIAGDVAVITHRHPLAYLSCSLYAYIIGRLTNLEAATSYKFCSIINDGLDLLSQMYPEEAHYISRLREIIGLSIKYAFSALTGEQAIARLGTGWTAPEALAIAIFSVLRYPDNFTDAILASVNHSGNSATTGAVTGGIIGTIVGNGAIPERFKKSVEAGTQLSIIAHDLSVAIPVSGAYDERCTDTPEKREWMLRYVYSTSLDQVPLQDSFLVSHKSKIYAGMYPEYHLTDKITIDVSSGLWSDFTVFYDLTDPSETRSYSHLLRHGVRHIHVPLFWGANNPAPDEIKRWIEDIVHNVSPLYYYDGNNHWPDFSGRIYIHGGNDISDVAILVGCLLAYLAKDNESCLQSLYEYVVWETSILISRMDSFRDKKFMLSDRGARCIRDFIRESVISHV